jgi:hypothetical protein
MPGTDYPEVKNLPRTFAYLSPVLRDSMQQELNIIRAARIMGVTPLKLREHKENGEGRCCKCKQWLPLAMFYPDKSRTSGYYPRCVLCQKEHARTRRKDLARYEVAKCWWCNKGKARVVPFRDKKVCVNRCYYEAMREVQGNG